MPSLVGGTAWAQSATTGAIAGVVRDATGAGLPGVTVETASPALIEKGPNRIGIQPVAFFVPSDSPRSENTFFYIVAHESRQKAAESWTKVINDPEFKEQSKQGEPLGKVTVDSMFVDPLDFSPIK